MSNVDINTHFLRSFIFFINGDTSRHRCSWCSCLCYSL